MTTTTKKTGSPILEAVHETARDLQSAGVLSNRRMTEYDGLCLVPVPDRKGLEALI